jgi:hypothetical protein
VSDWLDKPGAGSCAAHKEFHGKKGLPRTGRAANEDRPSLWKPAVCDIVKAQYACRGLGKLIGSAVFALFRVVHALSLSCPTAWNLQIAPDSRWPLYTRKYSEDEEKAILINLLNNMEWIPWPSSILFPGLIPTPAL